jgi:hypothetical protein
LAFLKVVAVMVEAVAVAVAVAIEYFSTGEPNLLISI